MRRSKIVKYAQKYEDLLPEAVPRYHAVISCIISQKISFQRSRGIRRKLYKELGSDIFTKSKIESLNLNDLGLDARVIEIIDQVNRLENLSFKNLAKISGIGKWTIDAVKILTYYDPDIALYKDKYIRKILSGLYGKTFTEGTAKAWFEKVSNKSLVSRFLWRLKYTSINKIIDSEPLTSLDLY